MIGLLALVRTLSSIRTSSSFWVDACSIIASGVVKTILRIAASRLDGFLLDSNGELEDWCWKPAVFFPSFQNARDTSARFPDTEYEDVPDRKLPPRTQLLNNLAPFTFFWVFCVLTLRRPREPPKKGGVDGDSSIKMNFAVARGKAAFCLFDMLGVTECTAQYCTVARGWQKISRPAHAFLAWKNFLLLYYYRYGGMDCWGGWRL